ncbi:hypothetical protein DDV98_30410 [Streptomyces sp. IB2014 011-12]|nr:hypothetical protein STIB_72980 [Streptomyces sp. IB2014 011-1]RDV48125.1 hypothetical protein DDV98_30410 [Streptomyces sp. IB2014 011-12]
MARPAESAKGLFEPVVSKDVEVVVSQVVLRSLFQEADGQGESRAEATRVHRRVQDSFALGSSREIAAYEFWCSGELLCQAPLTGVRKGVGEVAISSRSQATCLLEGVFVEAVRQGNSPPAQKIPNRSVWVFLTGTGRSCVLIVEVGPQCGQHQNWTASGG